MVYSRLAFGAAALLFVATIPSVLGQATSNATCSAQYQWMLNSKGQTPCLASAYLSAQCNEGQWNVPSLSNDGPYNHPQGDAANLCRCNTVTYNLLQACSICQGGVAGGWINWITNCTAPNITVGRYPLPLPGGVAIPSWAYIDFTTQDQFQPAVAQASANASPESMSVAATASSQAYSSSATRATGVGSTTGTPTATSAPSGGGTNVGPIVGGVIGGVLGLALLALIAYFLLRKKRDGNKTVAPSAQFPPAAAAAPGGYNGATGYAPQDGGYPMQQSYGGGHYTPVPVSQGGAYDQGVYGQQPYGAPGTPGTAYKAYDPSDPSTFPTTPAPPTLHSQQMYSEHGHPQQPRPGQYNYAAEL